MSLDSLLESLEKVTPVTSQDGHALPIKTFKNKEVTSVTPVTSQKTKPEIIFDETRMNKGSSNSVTPKNDGVEKRLADIEETKREQQREERRERALKMLDDKPDSQRVFITDSEADPQHVIVTIAIRGQYTFEMTIPREKYDAFLLLELIEKAQIQ